MNNYKRVLGLLMSLVMVLSSVSFTVFAEEIVEPDNGNIEEEANIGEWIDSFFGDNGGAAVVTDPANFEFKENENGTVTIRVSNNRGKIAGSVEGIAYYYQQLPAEFNYEIKATAKVDAWTANNQVAFGLMLRSNVLDYVNDSTFTGDYIAVGAVDQAMKGFYKYASGSVQKDNFPFVQAAPPLVGNEYELSIKKSGDIYVLTIGNETHILENYTGDINYAGLFVARNATVTFSDFEIIVDTRVLNELQVNTSLMKTEYLVGESIDLTDLEVTAVYDDESVEVLSGNDVIVTGFNSSQVGTTTITINYNGVTATADLQIVPLTVDDLQIKYYPAKMNYYKLDAFNPLGLTVVADYNDGYKIADLTEDLYTIYVNGVSTEEEPFIFENSGIHIVTVRSNETVDKVVEFEVYVREADLTALEVRQQPVKTQYFIDETLDLDGIVVYAHYDDGSQVRLMRNEFHATDIDTQTPGDKVVTLSHKGVTIDLNFNVKVRDLSEIKVTEYPRTTFFIGDEFTSDGLEVAKIFDNLDVETLLASEYTIDTTNFNNQEVGVYDIVIIPEDENLESIIYKVTVREKINYEWRQIVFGQSITAGRNFIEEKDGYVEITALEGGGKITADHDGISFYYVELDGAEDNFTLSADIKVVAYAKTPHDGQESFGIMARDAIGTHMDSGVFSSNIAAIGGVSGGTGLPNGTQLFARTGVLAPDGEGSLGIQRRMIEEVRPTPATTESNYKLTLSKTNSGFTGMLNNGEEVTIFEPEILKIQDDKMYVGFYTARLATIEVRNIELDVTAAATDAPRVDPPKEAVEPGVRVESLNRVSLETYKLMVDANVDGIATVRQGSTVIAENVVVEGGKILTIPTTIANNDRTNFSITFVPDETQYLTNYDVIVRNFTVDMRTYQEGQNIYVSPTGRNDGDGSIENPLDLDTAIEFVMPGQTIIVQDGVYVRERRLEINKYNDGTPEGMKKLFAAEGARPVIDNDRRVGGIIASGNYWHIKGIDFARSSGNSHGFRLGGSHNIIEDARFYENGDTGLQISRTDGSPNFADWPAHNLILNSTSFANRDPAENNADGFAAKITSGPGNVFDGNIAYNNADDGWDLYTKVGEGAIGPVVIRNSVAFNNGYRIDGTSSGGHGIGFKLGGEGVHVPHIIENSIAFGNKADGFSSNSNPGVIVRGQNIAFNNRGRNLDLRTYTTVTPDFSLDGFISFHYNNPGASVDAIPAVQSDVLRKDTNFLYNGAVSVNASGEELTINNFNNLVMPEMVNRLEDGSIDFSFLIYDANGNFSHELPEEPTEPTDPIEAPEGAIFFENFQGATGASLWTSEYRALPNDGSKPMYIRKSGETSVNIENDSITLLGGRFTIGAESSVDSTADTTPGGVLDLSKPYQIVIDIAEANGTGNFIVYVDNNTTGMANSPLGGDSRLYQEVANNIEVGQLIIESEVGTEASFIQLRTSGGGNVTIDSVTIKYIDEEPVEPVEPVEPGEPGDGEVPPVTPPTTPPTTPSEIEIIENEDGSVSVVPGVVKNEVTKIVEAALNKSDFNSALDKAQPNVNGRRNVMIQLDKVEGANGYAQVLPVNALANLESNHRIILVTEVATIELPNNTLSNLTLNEEDIIELNVANVEEDAQSKKVVEIFFSVNGERVNWNNSKVAVNVSIPYEVTDEDTEHLVIVYIDTNGNRTPVYNGRYNAEKGRMEFRTNHFSKYAVAYVQETFNDIGNHGWAQRSIEVLASRGIIRGTSVEEKRFEPSANISRADFVILLVKTLGLTADIEGNFDDVASNDYFYNEVAIAKELGIAYGVGNNKFDPREEISREDMMTLTARAMIVAGVTTEANDELVLDSFTDHNEIATYALESIAMLVGNGLIEGYNNNTIQPNGNATRAEMAMFMYRLYNFQ
ncbi:Ig-like protein group 3 [Natranaerovirga pectinivora]|uniref:Ig-like protein group 3 n=1 Tax=Natranaerovirga pectinivora TaxID=682400 RepID=A0A4R3MMF2_9FIRM|nr:S-layer homology domain-containing protein [Natranaerovirga pectinivora]TCT15473.1 Ig-like protein group 3 [Natranaerovirga pectinivora]